MYFECTDFVNGGIFARKIYLEMNREYLALRVTVLIGLLLTLY